MTLIANGKTPKQYMNIQVQISFFFFLRGHQKDINE